MAGNLNPQQKLASEAPNCPLLIVAGAGTGKTSTLAARLAHLIENGMPPNKICAITFTNKAAREMADRMAVDKRQKVPFIGTFHALGARILRKEAELLGRKPNFIIFDDHDSFEMVKRIVKKLLPKKEAPAAGNRKMSKAESGPAFFAQKISEIKNADFALGRLKQSAKAEDGLAARIYELYENKLRENNAFDFDDLIEKVVYIFKNNPAILKKYQDKFDAILVDEYQDLNPKQYELIKLLAAVHKNLTAVGDDEQMIYGWRYASLETFLNFEKDWPKARITFLEENYRSTGNIIGAASALAQNNIYRRPKNLWTKNPAGTPIKVAGVQDENREAELIAETISNDRISRAILYRTNAQSRAIEQALIRHQVPYQIFGGLKFYERKEIKDIVAALRYAMNENDELSRERLTKNFSRSKFLELEEDFGRGKAGSAKPAKLIEKFLETTDYINYLERNFTNYAERQENIGELISFALRFEDLPQFLEEIALVQAADIPSAKKMAAAVGDGRRNHGQTVHLSTIHLAKGLEFDCVFIAGCSEGLLPHSRSIDDKYRLEEERRLMYVAMTRAKKNLHISFYDLPSRFISELPRELIEFENRFSDGASSENSDTENYIFID